MSYFSKQQIEAAIAFHGHLCPGLAIGIRAAELAQCELDNPSDDEIVAVVETDMCGVDAIQFLTGATLGKGNLIHRDYGKMAFSFFCRDTGKMKKWENVLRLLTETLFKFMVSEGCN